jgi:hypothetical protein
MEMEEEILELKADIPKVFTQPTRLKILECLKRAGEITFENLISPTRQVWASSYSKNACARGTGIERGTYERSV